MTHLPRTLLAAVLLAAPAGRADAQPPPQAGPPAQQGAQQRAQQQARALTREGLALFRAGRYDEAIARFRAAHQLVSLPALRFNIAQAYRLKGPAHCAEALAVYRRYLAEADQGDPSRPIAQKHARALEACAARAASAPTQAALTSDRPCVAVPPLLLDASGCGRT